MRTCLFLIVALVVTACSQSATVEGDIYAAGGGIVLKGAGDSVHFLREPDSARAAMADVCERYAAARGPLHAAIDTASVATVGRNGTTDLYLARMGERIRRLPLRIKLSQQLETMAHGGPAAKADINGHFRIDSLPPGSYLVFVVDPGNMYWVDTLHVTAGARVKHDLTDMRISESVCAFPLVDAQGHGRFNGAL